MQKASERKSGGFSVKRLNDKWRGQTYSVKLFYHELDNYFIENELWKNLCRTYLLSDGNLRKGSRTQREAASITNCKRFQRFQRDEFHSPCDFVYGCHNDRMKVYGRWFSILSSFLNKSLVEKTSSEYCFGTLLSLAAMFTNVNCH